MCVELGIAPAHMLPSEGQEVWDLVAKEMLLYLGDKAAEQEQEEARNRLRRELGRE